MKRVPRRFVRFVPAAIVLVAAGGGLGGCRGTGGPGGPGASGGVGVTPRPDPLPLAEPVRGVWVARFHYRYPDDVRTIIRNCAALGCNTVYWQVRGEGTVTYRSKLEPWSREFNFADPGFDPLALAVEEAHKYRLRIEAWVNILPGWKGKTPPPLPGQLWNAHPDWFLQDARGQRQALGDFYLIVNPCLPEVRQHIVRVLEEIVTHYNVDGVHMDYVRYAWDEERSAPQKYPRDSRTLALYQRETGQRPDDDAAAWKHWRANQLTRLVSEIRTMLRRQRSGATLTAAVVRNSQSAYEQFFQNGVAWLRAGLVDALMPMVYTEKLAEFEADVETYRRLAGSRRIVPAVGIYKHNTDDVMRQQLARCLSWGGDFAVFSYGSLFPTHEDRAQAKPSATKQAAREWRRAVLGEFTGRARAQ